MFLLIISLIIYLNFLMPLPLLSYFHEIRILIYLYCHLVLNIFFWTDLSSFLIPLHLMPHPSLSCCWIKQSLYPICLNVLHILFMVIQFWIAGSQRAWITSIHLCFWTRVISYCEDNNHEKNLWWTTHLTIKKRL